MASTKKNSVRKKASRPVRKDQSNVASSTGYLVRKTFRSFTHSLEARLTPHDVSLSMWFFLRLLWERDGLTQKELSDELGLTQGTTVTAMDVMARRGLIERRRIDADRRKSFIFLTAKGRALRDELLPYAFEVNQAAEASISASELKQLKDILSRINVSLGEDAESFVARQ